ncbi:DUF523 domain-containing protein [Vogesella sp. LIG4]|uniref:DUF523 domain-containing protein n=1 Tax=Vogesella sp. LIG4 TaxID=1192162 RepID=UPI00081FCA2C|nr:DUF523 domain-containing protein [Vogesella sp. LIG4]SCK16067.1 Uncharacterized conserved protein YbbK, DUF523 family [Vogesella sp. LIG4]
MNQRPTLLVSACLLGQPVRYDGHSKGLPVTLRETLAARYRLVVICPEVAGGLPTPRPPAELAGGDGHAVLRQAATVRTAAGGDVSAEFIAGAQLALQLAQEQHCRLALLKANSPSCGNLQHYSGRFDGQLVEGQGVTAALLSAHGITVYNETQLDKLLD